MSKIHWQSEVENLIAERDHANVVAMGAEARNAKLEAEINRLHSRILELQITNGSLTDEIDKLKAELKHLSCPICGSDVNGKNWKSKAEKMAKALRLCMVNTDLQPKGQALGPDYACEIAKEALAEFNKEV